MNGNQPVSNQQIQWSYWYLTHREQLKRALTISLFVVCIVLWGYSLIRLTYFLAVEEPRTRAAVAALPKNVIRARDTLPPLEDIRIVSVEAFSTGDAHTDFYALVQNVNGSYAALSFTYSFAYDGGETKRAHGYLPPGGELILSALDQPTRALGAPQLFIENIVWKRILGWEEQRPLLLDFPVTAVTTEPLGNGARGGTRVHFVVMNNTSYNVWILDVPVVLLRGAQVIGINVVQLERVLAGEQRPVTLQWFDAPSQATSVRVVPQVNVLDPASFFKP